MPGPQNPAVASTVLPPVTATPIVDQNGILTVAGLNLFQQIWAGVFGGDGAASQIPNPGDLKPIAGTTVPGGWLLCDGTAYPTATYPALFAAIGTIWGVGGPGTFRVPPRGVFFFAADNTHPVGTRGGAESVVLSVGNLPSYDLTVTDHGHVHGVDDPEHDHTIDDPEHDHPGGSSPTSLGTAGSAPGTSTGANTGNAATGITINPAATGISIEIAETGIVVSSGGGDDAVDILPPYASINFLIKT